MQSRSKLTLCTAALIIGAALTTGPAGAAATEWISDELTVPLRSGPSTSHRILRVLPSGTELSILDRNADSGFVQVRTSAGTEGWLPEQYLVNQPIARDRLAAANRRINDLTTAVERQRAELAALNEGKSDADSDNAGLRRQVADLEQELAEIKRVSAGALELNESNQELNELNARLRSEVDRLVADVARLEENVQERWLLIGAGLVLGGLLLGVAIKARPRRSAWS